MNSSINTTQPRQAWSAAVLFTATIFLSASLLFFVQPLFAKIVLPLVGGAPAVWTTAMLFFQTVLICGYLYAHLSTRYLPVTAQVGLHLFLWAIALFFLPLSVQSDWQFSPDAPIAVQTLALFALGVGMPFAVLSANAPLIQSWYAKSGGPSADDPYFLYGASNLGSLVALLAFPLVAEPLFGAGQIGWGWAVVFVALGLFLALSGMAARKGIANKAPATSATKPLLKNYAYWLLLAFIPSSLMLAVTTTISTDLGSFPLVWVLPLALYLLTFVLTFTNKMWLSEGVLKWLFVASLAVFALELAGLEMGLTTISLTGVFLTGFFFIALKAHRMLYEARPHESNLTIFYVTMSVGGALGGVFNSLLAPAIFAGIHELRVTVFLAGLLLIVRSARPHIRDVSTAFFAVTIVVMPVALYSLLDGRLSTNQMLICVGVLWAIGLIVLRRNDFARFVMICGVLGAGIILTHPDAEFRDRSFFGTHLVRDKEEVRIYQHGTTIHGAQYLSEFKSGERPTPLYYYHPTAPMAQIINSEHGQAATDVGIVGLGVGSLACYARPGQQWQFYEIDVMVDRVARDPSLFSFMSTCAPDAPTHIGDARVVLSEQEQTRYDILVIDAYSSDAVPVHLTTNEAIALYRDRLKENGIMVLHISNRYYDLSLPLGRSAADLGLVARIQNHPGDPQDQANSPSIVVMMARDTADFSTFDASGKWDPLQSDGGRVWTDDYANLLSALK